MKFYQIHVPKTGGQSLWAYARQHQLDWQLTGSNATDREPSGARRHMPFSQQSIPDDRIMIVTLRCPIRHAISMYSYWRQNDTKRGKWQRNAQSSSFSNWLRYKHGSFAGTEPNLYVNFFGDGNFDQAVTNLRKAHHVLDTTYLTEQFNEIAHRYDLPNFQTHINRSGSFDIGTDDVRYLMERRAGDVELCRMFGVQIADYANQT